jgi:hypothetical protein
MTERKPELLPCPFCGGKARLSKGAYTYSVQCTECGGEVSRRQRTLKDRPFLTADDAIAAWNTRAPAAPPAQSRDEDLPPDEDLQLWFGLSYASWLTIPRVLMEAMPIDWQNEMAKLLMEYDAAYPNQPNIGTRVQVTQNGKLIKTPDWLINYRRPDTEMILALKGAKERG